MGNTRPEVDLSEESGSERLVRKAKEAPFVPIGMKKYNLEKKHITVAFFIRFGWMLGSGCVWNVCIQAEG